MQACSNSIADALELLQSCTKPSIKKNILILINGIWYLVMVHHWSCCRFIRSLATGQLYWSLLHTVHFDSGCVDIFPKLLTSVNVVSIIAYIYCEKPIKNTS